MWKPRFSGGTLKRPAIRSPRYGAVRRRRWTAMSARPARALRRRGGRRQPGPGALPARLRCEQRVGHSDGGGSRLFSTPRLPRWNPRIPLRSCSPARWTGWRTSTASVLLGSVARVARCGRTRDSWSWDASRRRHSWSGRRRGTPGIHRLRGRRAAVRAARTSRHSPARRRRTPHQSVRNVALDARSSRRTSASKACRRGRTALPAADRPADMATSILSLLERDDERCRLSAAARRFGEPSVSTASAAKVFEQICQHALRGARTR